MTFGSQRVYELPEGAPQDINIPFGDVPAILAFSLKNIVVSAVGKHLCITCPCGNRFLLEDAAEDGAPFAVVVDGELFTSAKDLIQYISQNEALEVQFDTETLPPYLHPEYNLIEPGAEAAPDQASSDSPEARLVASAMDEYADDAGLLVPSLNGLGKLDVISWGDNADSNLHDRGRFTGEISFSGPPSIQFSIIDGIHYPTTHTVLESDPYGMRLGVNLSRVPAPGEDVTFLFGGNAQMASSSVSTPADDYDNWEKWEIHLPDGSMLLGVNCMSDLGGGSFAFSLPAGVSDFYIRIPVFSNSVNDPDRTFTYEVLSVGQYQLAGGEQGTITIVDDSRVQDLDPNWIPPTPGVLPPDYVGPKGPIAQIQVKDGAWAGSKTQPENDSSDIEYRFQLLDLDTGGAFTPTEAIEVTIKVSGLHGLKSDGSGKDFNLPDNSFLNQFKAIDPGASFDPSTGLLTFTIPTGWTAGEVVFKGNTVPDFRMESGQAGKNETISFEITDIKGNEAVRGPGASTEILEPPVVSVAVDSALFFESDSHSTLSNDTTFTFKLTAPAADDLDVNLGWTLGPGVTNSDYEYSFDGGQTFIDPGTTPLPSQIRFEQGKDTVTITLRAKEDAASENPESFKVEIKPEAGGTDLLTHRYHLPESCTGINPALSSSAEADLIDDTSATHGNNGQYLDGPMVQLILTDASGSPLGTGSTSVLENGTEEVYYKLVLVNPDGSAYSGQHTENIDVELSMSGNSSNVIFNGPGTDYNFTYISGGSNWSTSTPGKITVTFPAGQSEVKFKGTPVQDNLQESTKVDGKWTNERVDLEISSVSGNESRIDINNDSASATIVDKPTVSISADKPYYSESESQMTFTVELSSPLNYEITVPVQWTGGGGLRNRRHRLQQCGQCGYSGWQHFGKIECAAYSG